MAKAGSLRHIDNTPLEETLKKIEQLACTHKEQKEKQKEIREKKEAVQKFTGAFLNFSKSLFSIEKKDLAQLDSAEVQALCENLLLTPPKKLWLICKTATVWASWFAAVLLFLSFYMIVNKNAFALDNIITLGIFTMGFPGSCTAFIWDNEFHSFLKAYRKCLRFNDKPGALMVEHAREVAQKEIPQ